MTLYHGIMDCHGVESFIQHEPRDELFKTIRANSNPQRHACYFQAKLPKPEVIVIEGLLKESDWEGACKYIKTIDGVTFFGPGKPNKIPDSSLDPYHPDAYANTKTGLKAMRDAFAKDLLYDEEEEDN